MVSVERGPEVPTPAEKLVAAIRLPYLAGCLVIILVTGFPGIFWLSFVTSLDFTRALRLALAPLIPVNVPYVEWQGLALLIAEGLAPFYALVFIRQTRMRVMSTESHITQLLDQGEKTFHKAFRFLTRRGPPILLTAAIFAYLSTTPVPPTIDVQFRLISAILFVPYFLIISNFIWVYFSSLWGLHRLGQGELRLRPYAEDTMFGLRPIGSLALFLALSYFGLIGIASLLLFFPTFASDVAFLVVLVGFGVLMFFLPLNSMHQKMNMQRGKLEAEARAEVDGLAKSSLASGSEELLRNLVRLTALQLIDRRISTLPTWPFDTAILSRFVAILLTVLGILIAAFLKTPLGLK